MERIKTAKTKCVKCGKELQMKCITNVALALVDVTVSPIRWDMTPTIVLKDIYNILCWDCSKELGLTDLIEGSKEVLKNEMYLL